MDYDLIQRRFQKPNLISTKYTSHLKLKSTYVHNVDIKPAFIIIMFDHISNVDHNSKLLPAHFTTFSILDLQSIRPPVHVWPQYQQYSLWLYA